MQATVKTKNGKKLKVKALVDFECTHTGIDEQLVKDVMGRLEHEQFLFSFSFIF